MIVNLIKLNFLVLISLLQLGFSTVNAATTPPPKEESAEYEQALDAYVQKVPNVITETQRVMSLFSKAIDFAVSEADRLGEFEKGVYIDENLGQAEILSIDGSQLVRILEPMGNEILFVHSPSIAKDSGSLLSYISQQNSVAAIDGRNLIVVWHSDNQIESAELHPKAKKWSFQYWKGYWAAVHRPATFDSFCFGIISGLAQATLTAGLGALQNGFTPHVAILSLSVFGFGSFIGTFTSTYRNIIFYSHSKLAQTLKQSVVSYAFAYMIFSINQVALGDPNHLTTFSEYLGLIFNIFLSTSAKNEFSQWARIKDLGKADLKEYKVNLPLIKKSFKFSEKDVNYQIKVQLTTQAIRTADLLGYHLDIPLSTGVYKVEIGKLLLWLSAPIVNLTVKKWAMKNYPETARAMGLDKSFKQSLQEVVTGTISFFRNIPQKMGGSTLQSAIKTELEVVDKSYLDALVANFNRSSRSIYSVSRCQAALNAAM